MKALKKLILGCLVSGAILGVSACAANQPNADDGFSIMGLDGPQGHRGGHHQGGHQMMMGLMIKELGLSDSQQAELQALRTSAEERFKAQHADHKDLKDAVKTAFLADKFDVAALSAQIQANKPEAQVVAKNMADHLVQAWQILTPEQQGKLEQRLSEMESRMDKMQGRFGGKGDPMQDHFKKMSENLSLSSEQQAQVKALWEQNKPDRQGMFQDMQAIKSQVLSELKSGQASSAKIAAILKPVVEKMGHKMEGHLQKMSDLHDVLTPVQRQKMVAQMEERAQNFHKGGHPGFGGHGRRG